MRKMKTIEIKGRTFKEVCNEMKSELNRVKNSNFHNSIIFFLDPFGIVNSISIYSEDYQEVNEWASRQIRLKEKLNIPFLLYVDGEVRSNKDNHLMDSVEKMCDE